jgi:hypothetical protein
MAVLIERACTPIFSSKMDTDSNSDGVADGFVSSADSSITATFAIDGGAQKINITASAGAGNARVSYGLFDISPNTVYSFQVLTRGTVTSGNFVNNISVVWYDSNNAAILYSDVGLQVPTAYWKLIKLENITSPSNAVKARIYLRCNAQAAGDTGTVWFRNVMLEQSTVCTTFCTTTRAADNASMNIAPLGDTWSISGAFALPYDNTVVVYAGYTVGVIFQLYLDNNNRCYFGYNCGSDRFIVAKIFNGVGVNLTTDIVSFAPYQIHKFILTQALDGIYLYVRKNNGTTTTSMISDTAYIPHNILHFQFASTYANAFIESLTLYRGKAITTLAEADTIFDNMNAEMVVNGGFDNGSAGWNLKNGSVWENSRIKRIATEASGVATEAARQEGAYSIKVLPNNTYRLKARLSGYVDANNTPYIQAICKDVLLASQTDNIAAVKPTSDNQVVESIFTTGANTYYVQPMLATYGTCTAYFDDISLQLIN